MNIAILFGPFIGDIRWELYRFSPYIIYLKRKYPKFVKSIVYTRKESFDLYGNYADILLPLHISDDKPEYRFGFKSSILTPNDYKKYYLNFTNKYKNKYKILETFCPDINSERYRIKWQFPKEYMIYDFKPRLKNRNIINNFINTNRPTIILDMLHLDIGEDLLDFLLNTKKNHNIIILNKNDNIIKYPNEDYLYDLDNINYDNNISKIGCLIYLLQKKPKFFIGNLDSYFTLLSFCMKQNIILVNEKRNDIDIKPLNPYKIKYEKVNNINSLKRML